MYFNEILTYIAIPNIGVNIGRPAYLVIQNSEPQLFLEDIYSKFPYIYNFIIITLVAVFCSMSSLLAYNLSIIFRMNKIAMLIITFLIIKGTEMFLPEEYIMQMYLQTWPASFLNFVMVFFIWIIVLAVTFFVGIKKEII